MLGFYPFKAKILECELHGGICTKIHVLLHPVQVTHLRSPLSSCLLGFFLNDGSKYIRSFFGEAGLVSSYPFAPGSRIFPFTVQPAQEFRCRCIPVHDIVFGITAVRILLVSSPKTLVESGSLKKFSISQESASILPAKYPQGLHGVLSLWSRSLTGVWLPFFNFGVCQCAACLIDHIFPGLTASQVTDPVLQGSWIFPGMPAPYSLLRYPSPVFPIRVWRWNIDGCSFTVKSCRRSNGVPCKPGKNKAGNQ